MSKGLAELPLQNCETYPLEMDQEQTQDLTTSGDFDGLDGYVLRVNPDKPGSLTLLTRNLVLMVFGCEEHALQYLQFMEDRTKYIAFRLTMRQIKRITRRRCRSYVLLSPPYTG
jgi:hypothetical protein